MKSLSQRALCEIERRLRRVRTADGYESDAGLSVFSSRRSIDPEQLPALVVWDNGETSASNPGGPVRIAMTVLVEAHGPCDQADTGDVLQALKADVKRALLAKSNGALVDEESAPRGFATIRYAGAQPSARDNGATSESIAMTFEVTYGEGCGNPYSDQKER